MESLYLKDQVFMVGNSVSPYPMAAIARANNPFITQQIKGPHELLPTPYW